MPKIDMAHGQLLPDSKLLSSLVYDTETGQIIVDGMAKPMPIKVTVNDDSSWTLGLCDALCVRCSPFHAGAIATAAFAMASSIGLANAGYGPDMLNALFAAYADAPLDFYRVGQDQPRAEMAIEFKGERATTMSILDNYQLQAFFTPAAISPVDAGQAYHPSEDDMAWAHDAAHVAYNIGLRHGLNGVRDEHGRRPAAAPGRGRARRHRVQAAAA